MSMRRSVRTTLILCMGPEQSDLRPDTPALRALIQTTVERAQARLTKISTDTLLFMGNWHQAIPTLLVQDPVLEPVDKLVWMVILLQARETGGRTGFPRYDTIAEKANIRSTSTISRAIAILRMTRWLTLCASIRDAQGQFRGNVYALHDEPLPLIDTLHLDANYFRFVQQSLTHHHARVCRVATAVLDSLDEDILAGEDITAPVPLLEQRAQIVLSQKTKKPQRYFAFTAQVLSRLNNQENKPQKHQDQNSKAVKKPPGEGSSSFNLYKNTTTTTVAKIKMPKQAKTRARPERLVYPTRLSPNQRVLTERYLAMVKDELHQALLDELQGRLASENKGMPPVYDELRFLYSLCKAAQQGEFVPNLGIKVKEAREQSLRGKPDTDALSRQGQLPLLRHPHVADQTAITQKGQEQLKALRQSLGLSTDKPRRPVR